MQLTPEQQAMLQEKLKQLSPQELQDLQKKNCMFCHLIAGTVPSKQIYQDKFCIAVLDIRPAAPGHLLLLPKEHYSNSTEMPDEVIAHLGKVAKQLSQVQLRSLKAHGTTTFVAEGSIAGQKAPHFMMHIIPRMEGDDIGMIPPSEGAPDYGLKLELEKALLLLVAKEREEESMKKVYDKEDNDQKENEEDNEEKENEEENEEHDDIEEDRKENEEENEEHDDIEEDRKENEEDNEKENLEESYQGNNEETQEEDNENYQEKNEEKDAVKNQEKSDEDAQQEQDNEEKNEGADNDKESLVIRENEKVEKTDELIIQGYDEELDREDIVVERYGEEPQEEGYEEKVMNFGLDNGKISRDMINNKKISVAEKRNENMIKNKNMDKNERKNKIIEKKLENKKMMGEYQENKKEELRSNFNVKERNIEELLKEYEALEKNEEQEQRKCKKTGRIKKKDHHALQNMERRTEKRAVKMTSQGEDLFPNENRENVMKNVQNEKTLIFTNDNAGIIADFSGALEELRGVFSGKKLQRSEDIKKLDAENGKKEEVRDVEEMDFGDIMEEGEDIEELSFGEEETKKDDDDIDFNEIIRSLEKNGNL